MNRPDFLPPTLSVRNVVIACGDDGFRALTRGEFPLSPTGFRSFHGLLPEPGLDALTILNARLDELAAECDRRTASALVNARRILSAPPAADPNEAFVSAQLAAATAVEFGFFAPTPLRAALWPVASDLLRAILDNPHRQPQPIGRWSVTMCGDALGRTTAHHMALGLALRGNVDALAPLFPSCLYEELPRRPGGEPDLSAPMVRPDAPAAPAGGQLALFPEQSLTANT